MEKNITLYSFVDFDRSARVRWALCELGLNFEEVRLSQSKGENKTESFLKISPFGKVPALAIDGESIFESGAICNYLAEAFSDKMALVPPFSSPLRASYNQWCYFACTTLESAVFAVLRAVKFQPETPEKVAALRVEALKVIQPLAQALEGKAFLVGNEFSVADILTGYVLNAAEKFGLLEGQPALQNYLVRLQAREGAKASKLFSTPWPV